MKENKAINLGLISGGETLVLFRKNLIPIVFQEQPTNNRSFYQQI